MLLIQQLPPLHTFNSCSNPTSATTQSVLVLNPCFHHTTQSSWFQSCSCHHVTQSSWFWFHAGTTPHNLPGSDHPASTTPYNPSGFDPPAAATPHNHLGSDPTPATMPHIYPASDHTAHITQPVLLLIPPLPPCHTIRPAPCHTIRPGSNPTFAATVHYNPSSDPTPATMPHIYPASDHTAHITQPVLLLIPPLPPCHTIRPAPCHTIRPGLNPTFAATVHYNPGSDPISATIPHIYPASDHTAHITQPVLFLIPPLPPCHTIRPGLNPTFAATVHYNPGSDPISATTPHHQSGSNVTTPYNQS